MRDSACASKTRLHIQSSQKEGSDCCEKTHRHTGVCDCAGAGFSAAADQYNGLPYDYTTYELVDTSRSGQYELYYQPYEGRYQLEGQNYNWYIYNTVNQRGHIFYGMQFYDSYVFWGDWVVLTRSSQNAEGISNTIYDPATGAGALNDLFDTTPQSGNGRNQFLGMAWHEASGRFVRLLATSAEPDAPLCLAIYSEEGAFEWLVETPFIRGGTPFHSPPKLRKNQLGMWGDYAVFYDFSAETQEKTTTRRIVFFNIYDGSYWFGQGDLFQVVKDRLLILDTAYDAQGNACLQAELYQPGQPTKTLWLPGAGTDHHANFPYNYAENKLRFSVSMVFDFAQETAYKEY